MAKDTKLKGYVRSIGLTSVETVLYILARSWVQMLIFSFKDENLESYCSE